MNDSLNLVTFALAHYIAVTAFAVLSYAVGRRFSMSCNYRSCWERVGFCTSLGLGIISYVILALGLLHLLYQGVVFVVLTIMVIVCAPPWKELAEDLTKAWTYLLVHKMRLLAGIAVVAIFIPILVMPLYPPTAHDSTSYHLAVGKAYAQQHSIVSTPYLRFPTFPQVNEMLFTLMILTCDDVAAHLVQFLMMGLIAVIIVAWSRRCLDLQVGLWGMALWLSNPLVLWLGSTAYIDVGLTLFITIATYALFNWLDSREDIWLSLCAIFCGMAAGTKYSALYIILCFALLIAYLGIREKKYTHIAKFILICSLVAAPWYVRNLWYTGNPVFPYFASLFGYGPWSAEDLRALLQEQLSTYGAGKTVGALASLPWNLAFRPEMFHANAPLSPIYFGLLPFLLLFGGRNIWVKRSIILILLYTLFWFATAQVLRYLAPVIPLLSLACAKAFQGFLYQLPISDKWANSLLTTVIVLALFMSPGWLYALEEIQQRGMPPTTPRQRDLYLERYLRSYQAYQFLNELADSHYTVYALYDANMAYFPDGQFMGDWFGPARYSRIVDKLKNDQALYEELRTLGARYFLIHNDNYTIIDTTDLDLFNSHLKTIYAGPYVLLFEVVDQPIETTKSEELLRNSGFEILENSWPKYWNKGQGNPRVDDSARHSLGGRVAVQSTWENWLYQRVRIDENGLYLLRHCTYGDAESQYARLQINWLDGEAEQILRPDIEVVKSNRQWQCHRMVTMAPRKAVWADVYVSVHGQRDVIWFDDFSFVKIEYQLDRHAE